MLVAVPSNLASALVGLGTSTLGWTPLKYRRGSVTSSFLGLYALVLVLCSILIQLHFFVQQIMCLTAYWCGCSTSVTQTNPCQFSQGWAINFSTSLTQFTSPHKSGLGLSPLLLSRGLPSSHGSVLLQCVTHRQSHSSHKPAHVRLSDHFGPKSDNAMHAHVLPFCKPTKDSKKNVSPQSLSSNIPVNETEKWSCSSEEKKIAATKRKGIFFK